MFNRLYIRKNLRQNFSEYVNIILIITISAVIINILSIYSDAVVYGNKLKNPDILDSMPYEQIVTLNVLKIVFMLIGIVCIYFVYQIFIEKKKSDLGILISLGISEKKLKKMLFSELCVIFIISYVVALISSNVLMYVLIQNFLKVENKNIILIVYRFSLSSSIFLLVLSFISVVAAFFISLKKILDIPIIEAVRNNSANADIKRDTDVWNKSSAEKFVAHANISRNKKHFLICSVISIPVVCISIVFLNYLNLMNLPSDQGDFYISSRIDEIYNNTELISEKIETLKTVSGINHLEYKIYFNNFLVEIDSEKLSFPIFRRINGIDYAISSIIVIPDKYLNEISISDINSENHVLLTKNIASSKYKVGDELYLDDTSEVLIISGFIDIPQYSKDFLDIYVTSENFEKIVGQPAIPNGISVYVDSSENISHVREEIYRIFDDFELFSIMDNVKLSEDSSQLFQGIQIIVTFLCSVLFVCSVILLWSFISYYVSGKKSQYSILKILGATEKKLLKITIYEALTKGLINSAIGLILGTALSYIVIKMSGYDMFINFYIIAVYIMILTITTAAHFIPSIIAGRKITNEKETRNGGSENFAVKENI